jgi:hypothetical protein
MEVSTRFSRYHPGESNSIFYSFNEEIFKFNQFFFQISSRWIRIVNKLSVFHFSIIIENTIHIIYGVRTQIRFMIHYFDLISPWSFFFFIWISTYFSFIPFLFFYNLMDELCLFSNLGFTYTTYITVKSKSFLVLVRLKKKKRINSILNSQNNDWVAPYISKSIQ